MRKQLRIGLLDSGIGGFSLLRELMMLTPPDIAIEWDYVADDGFAPYGLLSSQKLKERVLYMGRGLVERGVDLVVLACNTATAYGIESLREEFSEIPFVGVEPYLNVLHREPELLQRGEATAVLTTELMGKSPRFSQLIERLDPERHLSYYTCPQLASLVEEAYAATTSGAQLDDTWVKRLDHECAFLSERGLRQVILGCTHYPLIKDYFVHRLEILPISPCQHVARQVYNRLQIDVGGSPYAKKERPEGESFQFRRTSCSEHAHGGLKAPLQKKAKDLDLVLPQTIYESLR